MVFSSPVFLFFYLPAVLLAFWLTPAKARTPMLFLLSLLFYAWGEGKYLWLLLGSILGNWLLALGIDALSKHTARRALLLAAVVLNMGGLVYFKYTDFIVTNLGLPSRNVHLPIGISFITFEALSYVIDVYRRHTKARRNPIHVGFYVSFFPHLIAGPILRFDDVADRLDRPSPKLAEVESGILRFTGGLAKKLLVANALGRFADTIFGLDPHTLGTATAWAGILAYAFQIYFDFSAYSDMAIGLGRMCGFELPRNFDLPYSALNIRDFWRRWHISLSTWFRDYLYIPLGGNRGAAWRNYRNLVLVFFLCGLWHGASWTFVVWGLYHGLFLVLERLPFGRMIERLPRPLQHAYAMVVVLVGWVFFRADTFTHALGFLRAMAGGGSGAVTLISQLDREVVLSFLVALPLATLPVGKLFAQATSNLSRGVERLIGVGRALLSLATLVVCAAYLAAGTYNPFIYFRF